MPHIRMAALADEEALYHLLEALEETAIDRIAFRDIFRENMGNPHVHYLVCEISGRIVGFIGLHIQKLLHHTAAVAEVQELIVAPDKRGMGIGRQLMNRAIDISGRSGCRQIEVCCNKRRTNSHAFYRACGMTANHDKFCLPLVRRA